MKGGGIPLDRNRSEELNRIDWWLRESGHFPPMQQLRRIRFFRPPSSRR